MIAAEHIHPIFVHFIIAPLVIAVITDFLWLLKKSESLEKFSWYCLIIAGISGLLSVVSGLAAEENVVFSGNAMKTFVFHENLAFLLVVFLAIQVFWRFALKGKIPVNYSVLYFILITLCLMTVVSTSYFGGKLVFNHGVGVNSSNPKGEEIKQPEKKTPKFQFVIPDTSNN